MANEDNFKIEIQQQTNWKGTTFYYLYVNGEYVDLSADLANIEAMAQTAVEVYKSGAYNKTVLRMITGEAIMAGATITATNDAE